MESHEMIGVKIGALVVVFILALVPSLVPLKLRYLLLNNKKISENVSSIILSCSLCCGAGVLLATVFLHILAEAREGLQSLGHYSFAELIMCFGFFLVYLVEELTLLWVSYNQHSGDKSNTIRRTYSSHRLSISRINSSLPSNPSSNLQNRPASPPVSNNNRSDLNKDNNQYLTVTPEEKELKLKREPQLPVESIECNSNQISQPKDKFQVSLLRTLIAIGALSLHGALEGLALGLESQIYNVWLLCFALSAHKIFIGFSISMEMLEEGTSKLFFLVHIFIFALASPVGGAVGIILLQTIETNTDNGQIIIGVLQGISAGAILYVVFCEVLERERGKNKGRLLQFVSILVGFSIIAGLSTMGHSHDHNAVHEDFIHFASTQKPLSHMHHYDAQDLAHDEHNLPQIDDITHDEHDLPPDEHKLGHIHHDHSNR